VDALHCAVKVQCEVAQRNAGGSEHTRIEYRIGIHQGDIVVEDGDIFGHGVNIAARLEAVADPGGICVSARVHEDAVGKLDVSFDDLGNQNLENHRAPGSGLSSARYGNLLALRVRPSPSLLEKRRLLGMCRQPFP
jgi:adenylate cyclase